MALTGGMSCLGYIELSYRVFNMPETVKETAGADLLEFQSWLETVDCQSLKQWLVDAFLGGQLKDTELHRFFMLSRHRGDVRPARPVRASPPPDVESFRCRIPPERLPPKRKAANA